MYKIVCVQWNKWKDGKKQLITKCKTGTISRRLYNFGFPGGTHGVTDEHQTQ